MQWLPLNRPRPRLAATLATLSCSVLLCATPALAEDMDVDQADSLNFEAFHTDKKAAIQLWEQAPEKRTVKQYPETRTENTVVEERLNRPSAQGASLRQTAEAPAATGKPGQRYEIRERYTLGRSSQTPYSAFYVIEAMHGQMARLCPRGWQKLAEWSEPVEGDFYLYYELECR